jgi:transcription initiation factor TFIID subunit TAF12
MTAEMKKRFARKLQQIKKDKIDDKEKLKNDKERLMEKRDEEYDRLRIQQFSERII